MDFSGFLEEIKGKNVDVIGIGISNLPLIDLLNENGATVFALDRRNEEQLGEVAAELREKGVTLLLGEDYLDRISSDIIFKTPGLRFDVPQLAAARERGAVVTSEMEIFCEVCPAKIIAVTGSDGKTTTTTLIGKMLEAAGHKVWVGGNIGTPLLSKTPEISADDFVVLELSSFQLHTMSAAPDVAVITNISPNHLDMHKSYQEYIDAKLNICKFQSEGQKLILNLDNDVTRDVGSKSKKLFFSRSNPTADIYLNADGYIIYKNEAVLNSLDIKIPGMHNVENYMTAIGAVAEFVSKEAINTVAKTFGGVSHRIEFVREVDGVKYYNSSIDSSPNRTINTLRVFNKPVVLIAGGKDKGIPYDELGESLCVNTKAIVLIGATSDKILKSLRDYESTHTPSRDIKIIRAATYPEAVAAAKDAARAGDVVILSPASTSFDMFKNFEERGNLFKDIVMSL